MVGSKKALISRLMPLIVSFTFAAALEASGQTVAAEPPGVFVLQSYHAGLAWSDGIMEGVRSTLDGSGMDVTLGWDYLDARRYPDPRMLAEAADLVEKRIRLIAPDLIIACDNAALDFVVERRKRSFADASVVFCGINSYHPSLLKGEGNITGVPEEVSILDTVYLALKLHAGTRRLIVVGRTLVAADLANRSAFQEAIPKLRGGVEVEFWDDLGYEELRSRLALLEGGTVVFVNGLTSDESGRELMYDETTLIMREASPVPLYSLWDVYFGYGIVGGKLISGRKQGELAALLALRILKGEKADGIPVIDAQDANQYIFDMRELRRFGIDRSRLPAGSTVFYDEVTPWQQYWLVIMGAALFVVLQSAIIIMLVLNIRYRRRVRKELEEEKEQLGLALAGADLGTWDWDARTGAGAINDRWATMLGYQPEDIALNAESWKALVHPDDALRVEEAFTRHLEGKTPAYEVEHRLRHKSGEWIWVLSRGKVTERDEHGRALRACGTNLDVTERKSSEEKRLDLERRLLHSQKLESLGVLAGGIAHDFNNLLTTILGNLDLARHGLPSTSAVHGLLGEALAGARRAADLTRQMLAYSGKGRFVVAHVDLSGQVDELANLLRTSIDRRVIIDLRLERGLPHIQADPAQLQQVIMNLITNASEAIGPHGGTISITTGFQDCDAAYLAGSRLEQKPSAGRFVFLAVSDTGCGMDEKVRTRLFEPFFSSKSTGRGLGMSAVLGIMRGHNGAILVSSEVDVGTTIKVLFPALLEVEEAKPSPARDEAEKPSIAPVKEGIVLVVDDEESVRSLAQKILEHLGFRVVTMGDSVESLTFFRLHMNEILLVLLDLTMPKLDGSTVFREMRRLRPETKVILSSGYNQQEVVQRFAGMGLAGFVQKPYLIATLKAEINRVMGAGA